MRNEKGSVLIFALVLTAILMVLGLGLTMSSLGDFTMTQEFEARERALANAENGLAAVQGQLRGNALDTVLSQTSTVSLFTGTPPVSPRDPVAVYEARNVDYSRLPSPLGSVSLAGLLTPATGTTVGRGRYFARVSDNDDGDGDPLMDSDGRVFIRVAGIEPGPPQESVLFGSNLKNSVVMVEAALKRVTTFDVKSPFSVYGPSATPSSNNYFVGNSFIIDGYDHSDFTLEELNRGNHRHDADDEAFPGISILYDNPDSGDGSATADTVYNGLSDRQYDNVSGVEGDYGANGPSIREDTQTIRESGSEDATNIFDAEYMAKFINRVSAVADETYADGTRLSGSDIVLGTREDPKIVVAEGDLALTGGGSGCGLLVVKGKLDYNGAFNWDGLILIVGDGELDIGGANKAILGGVYLANISRDADGNPYFGVPSFTLAGNSTFFFSGDSVKMAINLLPLQQVGWREITAEISE